MPLENCFNSKRTQVSILESFSFRWEELRRMPLILLTLFWKKSPPSKLELTLLTFNWFPDEHFILIFLYDFWEISYHFVNKRGQHTDQFSREALILWPHFLFLRHLVLWRSFSLYFGLYWGFWPHSLCLFSFFFFLYITCCCVVLMDYVEGGESIHRNTEREIIKIGGELKWLFI